MKKIAYIITNNSKIKNNKEYIGVVDNIKKATPNTPILIIGLENARKIIPNFSILNRNPEKDLFWTFGKREKRNEYEKDLKDFNEYIINSLTEKIKYYYINPLTLNKKKIFKLLRLVYDNRFDKYFYIENGMLYCYFDNKIIGISIKIINYAYSINEKRIINLIKCNQLNHLMFYYDEKIKNFKKIISNQKTYLMSFLVSLIE